MENYEKKLEQYKRNAERHKGTFDAYQATEEEAAEQEARLTTQPKIRRARSEGIIIGVIVGSFVHILSDWLWPW